MCLAGGHAAAALCSLVQPPGRGGAADGQRQRHQPTNQGDMQASVWLCAASPQPTCCASCSETTCNQNVTITLHASLSVLLQARLLQQVVCVYIVQILCPAVLRAVQGLLWPTTPLIYASKMGHKDMVALLMERGANVAATYKVGGDRGSCRRCCGWGAVRVFMGHRDMVALLMERGANVAATYKVGGVRRCRDAAVSAALVQ